MSDQHFLLTTVDRFNLVIGIGLLVFSAAPEVVFSADINQHLHGAAMEPGRLLLKL